MCKRTRLKLKYVILIPGQKKLRQPAISSKQAMGHPVNNPIMHKGERLTRIDFNHFMKIL